MAWAAALGSGACGLTAAEPPAGPLERFEVRTAAAPRTVEATVVVEAVDGGLLVERPDQRYEVLQPDAILSREPLAAARPPESHRELGRRVLAELPVGFDLHVTKHYVVCFNTSREYAVWCAALFERLHETFLTFWRNAGLDVAPPAHPAIVVIFANRQEYEAFAAGDLGAAADRVVGYYNLLSNRVTTFDLTGSETLAHEPGRGAGKAGLEILASPAATGLVSTLVHEATHQLAFNSGMHRRLAPVPVWVSEGIATYFETPDLKNPRGWRGIGQVNDTRLDRFLQSQRPGMLQEIVAGDEPFRRADDALDAYARAWALTSFLVQTRKKQFADYLGVIAAKQPFAADSAEQRVREFEAAFGETPAELEAAVLAFMARLQSRRR